MSGRLARQIWRRCSCATAMLTAKQDKLIAVTEEDPRFPDIANTGVIMLRNASRALDMLEDWWLAVIRHPEWSVLLKAWSFEQGAFTHMVYPEYKEHVSLLQLERYNSPEGRAHLPCLELADGPGTGREVLQGCS